MSLASILVVVCFLLAPGARDLYGRTQEPVQKEAPQKEPSQHEGPQKEAPQKEAPQTEPAQKQTPPVPFPETTPGKVPEEETPLTKDATKSGAKKPLESKARAKKKAPPRRKSTTAKSIELKPDGSSEKRVVRNGSATDPTTQISPSLPQQQASSQRQSTNSLLSAAETNLKNLSGAQLNTSQEEMVKQVHTYMEQSKAAVEAGDLERANNLAIKAQLLSAELVKK